MRQKGHRQKVNLRQEVHEYEYVCNHKCETGESMCTDTIDVTVPRKN